jgi:membrane protein
MRAPDVEAPAAVSPLDLLRQEFGQIARTVWNKLDEDNLSLIAAGVAFYAFLAVFPAVAAIVALYGFSADPHTIREHLAFLRAVLPAAAYQLLIDQIRQLLTQENVKLGFSFAIGLLFSVWSASRGVVAIMTAMNVAYDDHEERGAIRLNLVALGFTVAATFTALAAIIVVGGLPEILHSTGIPNAVAEIVLLIRWPVFIGFVFAGLIAIYRYGPSRTKPRFLWIAPGATFALLASALSTAAFSLYVAHWGSYNQTFGSLAAGVILLLWFYLTAYSVCVGAELNAELELRSRRR